MLNGEVPGMKEWICELKNAGYKVYGLSNWSHETFPMVKDKYEAFSMMDGIVMSGEELIAKPDLRIYKILLERYGLKAEECIFIDDRKENIIAGEQVGIRGIIFEDCEQVKQAFHVLNQKSNEY
jgi:2-haloacid dehalogenase